MNEQETTPAITGAASPRPVLTAERLRELLSYDPSTGIFTWKPRPGDNRFNARRAGKVAGTFDTNGYITIGVDGRDYRAHRLAWAHHYGTMPTAAEEIDHRDNNRLNNAITNLRLANSFEQKSNLGLRRNNTSGVKGVSFVKETGRWRAYIQARAKWRFLGSHATLEAAAAARKAAAEELHGAFANHARRAPEERAAA